MSELWSDLQTAQQRKILNAACGDLAKQINWHGNRLSKDEWRHFFSGTVMGWRMLPAYDYGNGAPGFIMLGGSSLKMNKKQYSEAITMVFHLGDDPLSQGLQCKRVQWCQAVRLARGIPDSEI